MIRKFITSPSTRTLVHQAARHNLLVKSATIRPSWLNHPKLQQPIARRSISKTSCLTLQETSVQLINKDNEQANLPIPTTKKSTPKSKPPTNDARAASKLSSLSTAKENVSLAIAKYTTRLRNTSPDDTYTIQLKQRLAESHKELGMAYSAAIKYTSRLNSPHETKIAEGLVHEWMDRFLDEFKSTHGEVNDEDGAVGSRVDKHATMKKKAMVKTLHNSVRFLNTSVTDDSLQQTEIMHIPPPQSKDYLNILRAYSSSKAKKKGESAECLLVNMLEVAKAVSSGDKGREVHKAWVRENVPSSKMFALGVKCYAGSTHKEAAERINYLTQIHNDFAKASQNKTEATIPGLYINDPYVMLHSIKSLRNFHVEGEREKAHDWLGKLHEFVVDPGNFGYFSDERGVDNNDNEDDSNGNDSEISGESNASIQPNAKPSQVDVTSAYLTVIRLLARLRGEKGAAAEARGVLDKMHVVHDVMVNGYKNSKGVDDNNGDTKKQSIAFIDIRTNAYNLILGMYRDSKLAQDADKALELLKQMMDAASQQSGSHSGVPLPNHQSFEYTILALAKMTDGAAAISEAEKLIASMEESGCLPHSIVVYNALLSTCTKVLHGKSELYDKAMEILDNLNEKCKAYPELAPNPETISLVIKACAHSDRNDHNVVLETANKLFSDLLDKEDNEKSALVLTDNCYYHMMLCVINHLTDNAETKQERLEELFSQACQRGLCSNSVLTLFRNNTSEEEYRLTVGKGRLADHWIANVTSPRALYTDGSTKGAGKNARRVGKSTSGWVKKQKVKEEERRVRKETKRVKKMIRKM